MTRGSFCLTLKNVVFDSTFFRVRQYRSILLEYHSILLEYYSILLEYYEVNVD